MFGYPKIIYKKCKIWRWKISLCLVVGKSNQKKIYFKSKQVNVKILQSNFLVWKIKKLREILRNILGKIVIFNLFFYYTSK